MNDTISVVIPAYNARDFLQRAVRSALEQSYPVLEVIIVDDASTDDTREIARALADEDDRVRLLALTANCGPAKARNVGFDVAKGDWIAVLDADDAYLPDRLSHLVSNGDGADIIADNLLPYDAVRDHIGPPVSARTEGWETIDLATFADARGRHDDFGLFQPIFRREFLQRHSLRYPEDVRHGEDFLLVFEALLRGAVYLLSWSPGYLYTTRHSGWSRTQIDYKEMGERLTALLSRTDVPAAVQTKLRDRISYVEDLHAREQLKGALKQGKILRALTIIIAHPILLKFALAKMRRVLQ